MSRWLVLSGLPLCALAPLLGAQTRFTLPDTTPDLARYQSPEECLAAGARVELAVKRALPFWPDTIVVGEGSKFDTLPAQVSDVVRRCIKKFPSDSVKISDYDLWIPLYLMAGQDEVASSIAERRLGTAGLDARDSVRQRFQTLAAIADIYEHSLPIRLTLLNTLWSSYLQELDQPSDDELKMVIYAKLLQYKKLVADSAAARSFAQEIVTLSEKMTETQKRTEFYEKKCISIVAYALDFLNEKALLDSLRESSAAYIALKHALWKRAGVDWNKIPSFFGEKAPPLTGEFVFAPDGEQLNMSAPGPNSPTGFTISRPTRGKVSIVVFLYGGCRAEAPGKGGNLGRTTFSFDPFCHVAYTVMHRLAKQFPAVEMTIASQTLGYVGNSRPLTPAEEANVLQSWWLGFHRLPATLIIENTQFFNLEKYDGRRIDYPTDNTTHYLFGNERARGLSNTTAFLIDVDGTVLNSGQLTPGTERSFREMLEIITKRPK